MPDHVIAVDVVVLEPPAVIDVASVGVQGPPGATGPAGPAGPTGEPGPPGAPGTGTGDVTGPASATADAIAVFSGTTGKLVKDAVGAAAFGRINGLVIGTNAAVAGAIRLPNNATVAARNAANTADVQLFNIGPDNNLQLGFGTANGIGLGGHLYCNAKDVIGAANVGATTAVAVGTNPAQSGAVRLANTGAIVTRNAGNNGDTELMRGSPWGGVELGNGAAYVQMSAVALFNAASHLQFEERTAPGVPIADRAHVWVEDNGAGKSRLMVQFNTGAAIQLAIQP